MSTKLTPTHYNSAIVDNALEELRLLCEMLDNNHFELGINFMVTHLPKHREQSRVPDIAVYATTTLSDLIPHTPMSVSSQDILRRYLMGERPQGDPVNVCINHRSELYNTVFGHLTWYLQGKKVPMNMGLRNMLIILDHISKGKSVGSAGPKWARDVSNYRSLSDKELELLTADTLDGEVRRAQLHRYVPDLTELGVAIVISSATKHNDMTMGEILSAIIGTYQHNRYRYPDHVSVPAKRYNVSELVYETIRDVKDPAHGAKALDLRKDLELLQGRLLDSNIPYRIQLVPIDQ